MTESERPPEVANARRELRFSNWLVLGAGAWALVLAVLAQVNTKTVTEQRDVAEAGQVTAEARADSAEQLKRELVDRAIALCDPNDPAVERLRAVGLCDIAQQEKNAPSTAQQPPPTVSFAQIRE